MTTSSPNFHGKVPLRSKATPGRDARLETAGCLSEFDWLSLFSIGCHYKATANPGRAGTPLSHLCQDLNHVRNRIQSSISRLGIACGGAQVYAARYRGMVIQDRARRGAPGTTLRHGQTSKSSNLEAQYPCNSQHARIEAKVRSSLATLVRLKNHTEVRIQQGDVGVCPSVFPSYFNFTKSRTKIPHTPTVIGN
jgi:hypothetical protein